jgi:hypothetical protein
VFLFLRRTYRLHFLAIRQLGSLWPLRQRQRLLLIDITDQGAARDHNPAVLIF